MVVAVALVVAWVHAFGVFSWQGTGEIFRVPVSAREGAQLGLLTEVVSAMESGGGIYGRKFGFDEYRQENAFAPGAALPFLLARLWGFDWRFASLVGLALLGATAAAAGIALIQRAWRTRETGEGWQTARGLLAFYLCGVAWLSFPTTRPYLNWGNSMPLWPLIAGLGISLALRWPLMVAMIGGFLATMSVGWLALLPVVAAVLWMETPGRRLAPISALLGIPLLAYASQRGAVVPMIEGILGSAFRRGMEQGEDAWRFPSIHGFTDLVNLRVAVYCAAVASILLIAREVLRRDRAADRFGLLALAAFAVVLCGPVTYIHHWMAHAILLAGIGVAIVCREGEERAPTPTWGPAPAWAAGLAAAILVAIPIVRVASGVPEAIDRAPEFAQHSKEFLVSGFNVRSEDYAWGRDTVVETGFALERRQGGLLEIGLGTLGGDFTPYNPVTILVNGRPKAVYRDQPGAFTYAQVRLDPSDVHVGFNRVTLHSAWARTPRSLGVGDDNRLLSVCYRGMRFIPTAILPRRNFLARSE